VQQPLDSDFPVNAEEWSQHPFSQHLAALGFRLTPYRFSDTGEMLLGLRFYTETAEIVFNYEPPDKLRVVLYRRINPRVGTANAFQDFVWLLFEASDPRFGIEGIIGTVSPPHDEGVKGLSAARIAAFYTRYLGAKKIGYEWGSEIIYGSLANFRASWKRRPPPAKPRLCSPP
jgi:type III secretion system regulator LcrR